MKNEQFTYIFVGKYDNKTKAKDMLKVVCKLIPHAHIVNLSEKKCTIQLGSFVSPIYASAYIQTLPVNIRALVFTELRKG